MQSVPLSPVPASPSTPEWLRAYLPALVGRKEAALAEVETICSSAPGQEPMESLVWAVRALWVINHLHRAESVLSECLSRGGLLSAELGTFGHPHHGVGYGWVRVALAETAEQACEAHCDLAVLAIRRGEEHRARIHVERALEIEPAHIESQRWQALLLDHSPCVLRWIHREPPVSAEAACRLLDLWPDHSNGHLSPCRFRAVRKRAHSSC